MAKAAEGVVLSTVTDTIASEAGRQIHAIAAFKRNLRELNKAIVTPVIRNKLPMPSTCAFAEGSFRKLAPTKVPTASAQ